MMYMSPEGVPSKAADVFALGVTLFALLGCDCDESRIPSTALPGGAGVVRDTPALLAELSAGQLGDKVSQLLASMLASVFSVPLTPSHPLTPTLWPIWRAGACGGPCPIALSSERGRSARCAARRCHGRAVLRLLRLPARLDIMPRGSMQCAEWRNANRRCRVLVNL